jgi:hypothetical protein
MKASPEQKRGGTAGQSLRHLLSDAALPLIGLRLAVHPDADRKQDDGIDDRPESLGQFPARAADADHPRRNDPGEEASGEGADPTCVDARHDFHPLGLAEKRDRQRFKSLAQQNRRSAEERREGACRTG